MLFKESSEAPPQIVPAWSSRSRERCEKSQRLTGCSPSPSRLYYESSRAPTSGRMGRIEVSTGVVVFPFELFISPRKWAEASYNITHWTEMPGGGHFAAMEQPELFVEDLRTFFKPLRSGL